MIANMIKNIIDRIEGGINSKKRVEAEVREIKEEIKTQTAKTMETVEHVNFQLKRTITLDIYKASGGGN